MFAPLLLLALGAEPTDLSTRVDAGEIVVWTEAVPNSQVPRAKMQGVIEAPPEKVWAVIEHCANYSKTMPRVLASKELSRDGGVTVCEVTIDMPFPLSDLTSKTEAVLTADSASGRWERRWKLLSGDYAANTGAWVLTRYQGDPGRTLASYEVLAAPKTHVPQGILDSAQSRSLPKVIEGLREQTRR